jgi:hypothetical protein
LGPERIRIWQTLLVLCRPQRCRSREHPPPPPAWTRCGARWSRPHLFTRLHADLLCIRTATYPAGRPALASTSPCLTGNVLQTSRQCSKSGRMPIQHIATCCGRRCWGTSPEMLVVVAHCRCTVVTCLLAGLRYSDHCVSNARVRLGIEKDSGEPSRCCSMHATTCTARPPVRPFAATMTSWVICLQVAGASIVRGEAAAGQRSAALASRPRQQALPLHDWRACCARAGLGASVAVLRLPNRV